MTEALATGTKLPDKPQVEPDLIRHYQLRPIKGQLPLFAVSGDHQWYFYHEYGELSK